MIDWKRVRPSKSADVSFPVAGLSARANNSLRDAGIRTARELAQMRARDVLQLRNVGRRTVAEFERFLAGIGLHFQ